MEIVYGIFDCPLGKMMIGMTERGICALELGQSAPNLESALRAQFGDWVIQHDDEKLRILAESIIEHLEGQRINLDVKLDMRGTDFQKRVWQELRNIPYGCTRSYSEVAISIGRPKAVRAVAQACASNPVPVIVPCHRVIRKDGNLAGFRGGIEYKKALLNKEATVQKLGPHRIESN